MSEAIIVFNAGSTSVKFGSGVAGKGTLTPISQGEVSDIDRPTVRCEELGR